MFRVTVEVYSYHKQDDMIFAYGLLTVNGWEAEWLCQIVFSDMKYQNHPTFAAVYRPWQHKLWIEKDRDPLVWTYVYVNILPYFCVSNHCPKFVNVFWYTRYMWIALTSWIISTLYFFPNFWNQFILNNILPNIRYIIESSFFPHGWQENMGESWSILRVTVRCIKIRYSWSISMK